MGSVGLSQAFIFNKEAQAKGMSAKQYSAYKRKITLDRLAAQRKVAADKAEKIRRAKNPTVKEQISDQQALAVRYAKSNPKAKPPPEPIKYKNASEWHKMKRAENAARVAAMRRGEKSYISPALQAANEKARKQQLLEDNDDIFDDYSIGEYRLNDFDGLTDTKRLAALKEYNLRGSDRQYFRTQWPIQLAKKKEDARLAEIYRGRSAIAVRTGKTFAEDLRPEMQALVARDMAAASKRSKAINQKIRSTRGKRAGASTYFNTIYQAQLIISKRYGLVAPLRPTNADAYGIRGNEEAAYRKLVGGKRVRTQREYYAGKIKFNLWRKKQQQASAARARFKSVGDAKAALVQGRIDQERDRNVRLNLVQQKLKEESAARRNPVKTTGFAPGSSITGFSVLGTPGIARSSGALPTDRINITGAYVSPGSVGVQGFTTDKPIYQKPLTEVEIARRKTDTKIEIAMGTFDFGSSTGSALFEAQKKRPDKPKSEQKKTVVTYAFEGAGAWLSERILLNRDEPARNLIINPGLAIAKGAVDVGASAINLAALGGSKLAELITGKDPGYQQIGITETSPVSSGIGAGIESILSGGSIGQTFQSAKEAFVSKSKEVGEGATGGDIFFYAAPLATIPTKLVGLKTLKVPTGSGGETVARSLELGVGRFKKSIPIGKTDLKKLTRIEPVDRGFEFSTAGGIGTKVLTSQQALLGLQKAGKMLPRDVEAVPLGKRAAELIRVSAKKVSPEIRLKASLIPDVPLTTLKPGKESRGLIEGFLPGTKPFKGTLAETIQLEKDLVIKPTKGLKTRDVTTGDLDLDYTGKLGKFQAQRQASRGEDILNRVAEPGRKFEKSGTNVLVKSSKDSKPETVINIVTDKDAKTGYLNKITGDVFGVKLRQKPVEILTREGKKVKAQTIEEQALHRIESTFALQSPKTDKFRGVGRIPYLAKGYDKPQATEKGFTILATEHRLKDVSKLVSQDFEQISRNLRMAGYKKEGAELAGIGKRMKQLYPEIDFTIKSEKASIGISSTSPSLASTVSKSAIIPISATAVLGIRQAQQTKPQATGKPLKVESVSTKIPKTTKPISTKSVVSSSYSKPASRVLKSLSPSYPSRSVSRSLTSSKPSGLSKTSKGSAVSSLISKPSLASSSALSPGSSPGLSALSPGLSSSSTSSLGSQASSLLSVSVGQPTKIVETTKPIAPLIILWKSSLPEPRPRPTQPRADFIGNVSEVRISEGIKKKYDIKYGRISTAKISRKDIRKSKLGVFVKAPKKRTIPERKIDYVLTQKTTRGKQPTLLISHVNQKIRLNHNTNSYDLGKGFPYPRLQHGAIKG